MSRGAELGEFPPLNGGKTLPERVDFRDIRTAGQQLPGDVFQFGRVDQWLFKQGGAAAGQQKEDQVFFR